MKLNVSKVGVQSGVFMILVAGLSLGSARAAVVATVGNANIDSKDLALQYASLNEMQKTRVNRELNTRREIVEGAINAELLTQAAKKAGLENEDEYKRAMDQFRRQYLATKYMQSQVESKLTKEAMGQFYKNHAAKYDSSEVRAQHILLNSESEAMKVLAEAQKAKDSKAFGVLAKKHSVDQTVQENQGDLGYFTRDRMVPEFSQVAFSMKKGEVKGPIKSAFGYHIIRVNDIKTGRIPGFPEVEARVREDLRAQVAKDILLKLRSENQVKVNNDAVESMRF